MSKQNEDKLVLDLLNKVEEKKKQIGNAERPQWQTTCSFKYNIDSNNQINIQTQRSVEDLLVIHGYILAQKNSFEQSARLLSVNAKYSWLNFSFEQWESDIKTRITQLQIKTKKDELSALETRINALITPEQRRTLELEKLMKEIG